MKTYKSNLPELTIKYKTGDQKKMKITSSHDANVCLKGLFDSDTIEYREDMILLLLNRANNTLGWMKISVGGMSATICDLKIIFSCALNAGASGIILAHNHPSGTNRPSESDIRLTDKIKAAGKILEIPLLDHIIVTPDENFYSFADNGLI